MNHHASRPGARACAAVCFCLLLCAAAPAQDLDDVTFSGTVRDQHGALLPGANVTAVAWATNAQRTVTTDDEGRYRLVELPPGAYSLRVTRAGFADEERTTISTRAGQHLRLDLTLRVAGPTAEVLTVSAAASAQVRPGGEPCLAGETQACHQKPPQSARHAERSGKPSSRSSYWPSPPRPRCGGA